jgi:hypothetical protein
MEQKEKTRENRLRRLADRRGYRLMRSSSRDPDAIDYGLYALLDVKTGGTVNPAIANRWICAWTLDDVEDWINEKIKSVDPTQIDARQQLQLSINSVLLTLAAEAKKRVTPEPPKVSGGNSNDMPRLPLAERARLLAVRPRVIVFPNRKKKE